MDVIALVNGNHEAVMAAMDAFAAGYKAQVDLDADLVLTGRKKSRREVIDFIQNFDGLVILRRDFKWLGSESKITRTIAAMVTAGELYRFGTGLYTKTRFSILSGKPVPCEVLAVLSFAAMERLGVEVTHGSAALSYMRGETTQIPVKTIIDTGKRRISRKIQVGSQPLYYEAILHRKKRK